MKKMRSATESVLYSSSNPLTSNFSVRLFSVTVRTTCSGAPSGMFASISSVTLTAAQAEMEIRYQNYSIRALKTPSIGSL